MRICILQVAKDGDKAEREGKIKWFNGWYEVVIAVVAVGPFAMGVRYSVYVVRRMVDGDSDCAPPCLGFA